MMPPSPHPHGHGMPWLAPPLSRALGAPSAVPSVRPRHAVRASLQLVRVQDPFDKLLVRPFSKSQAVTRTITATIETGGVSISQQQVTEAGVV